MYYSSGNYEAFATPKKPEGIENKSAYVVGTGLAGLAAACFLIRDAQMPGEHITLFEHLPVAGGSCDGIYDATKGFIMRGGREMDNHFECMWDLFKSIPSIVNPGETIFSEYYYLNKEDPNFSLCRVTEKQGQDAHTDRKYGLTPGAATQLLKLFMATNKSLEDKKIDDVFDDEFYATNFWTYWQTMFAFEKWHSALEMKLYLQRYIHHIDGLPDLSALRFTRYNQYESMILPMCKYITDHGGKVLFDTTVTNIVCDCTEDKKVAKKIEYTQGGVEKVIELTENDLVICTNGCQGDASAYGDNTHAPVVKVKNGEGPSVEMWKKLAAQDPAFGHPEKFFKDIKETSWESWTVDTANKQILDAIQKIGNHLRITANRDSLIKCIEIIVIKSQTNRKSLDNKGRKLCARTSPLLLCISLDQFLIDICTNKADSLLFKVLRLCDTSILTLLLDLRSSLLRCYNTPHLIKCVHIERKAVQLPMIIGNRAVCKTVELSKLCNIIPYFLIICVENMCTILMNVDSFNLLCIYISSNVRAFIDYKNRLARLLRLMSKDSAVQTGTYDKIIVHFVFSPYYLMMLF